MAANSSVPGRILSNFEPIQDFMVVLVTCKYKEEPIKNEGARVVTRFSPLLEGQKALNRLPEFCLKLTYSYLLKSDHVPSDTKGSAIFDPRTKFEQTW